MYVDKTQPQQFEFTFKCYFLCGMSPPPQVLPLAKTTGVSHHTFVNVMYILGNNVWSISQFHISETHAFRQPIKAVNWLWLGLDSSFSAPHPRAVRRSQLTALFGCRNARGSEMSNWLIYIRRNFFFPAYSYIYLNNCTMK